MDRVRVLRLVEYEGPRQWVEQTVALAIHGRRLVGHAASADNAGYITGVTISQYPEILEAARQIVAPNEVDPRD